MRSWLTAARIDEAFSDTSALAKRFVQEEGSEQVRSLCALAPRAAEKFAALDLNWWTCITEEVIGPDLQEMRNIHLRLKPTPWIASDWEGGESVNGLLQCCQRGYEL